jgi:hypothetical protein
MRTSYLDRTDSHFNVGLEETSPEDFNERETNFKIPSESRIQFKNTVNSNISGLNYQQFNSNHNRINSVQSHNEQHMYNQLTSDQI